MSAAQEREIQDLYKRLKQVESERSVAVMRAERLQVELFEVLKS